MFVPPKLICERLELKLIFFVRRNLGRVRDSRFITTTHSLDLVSILYSSFMYIETFFISCVKWLYITEINSNLTLSSISVGRELIQCQWQIFILRRLERTQLMRNVSTKLESNLRSWFPLFQYFHKIHIAGAVVRLNCFESHSYNAFELIDFREIKQIGAI